MSTANFKELLAYCIAIVCVLQYMFAPHSMANISLSLLGVIIALVLLISNTQKNENK